MNNISSMAEEAAKAAELEEKFIQDLIKRSETNPGGPFEDDAQILLAKLKRENPAKYECIRADLKKAKVRIGELDKLINLWNEALGDGSGQGQGKSIKLPEPEPWGEPVDGVLLVCELINAISRYVIMPEESVVAVALWVIHTYIFDSFHITPRLTISSPEKGCGKTTLLDVLA